MDKYILIPARTGSEWDSVSFALLPYSKELLTTLLETKAVLEGVKKQADAFVLYTDDVDFFTNEEELPEHFQPQDEETPLLIELSTEQYATLTQPEQTIKYGQRVIDDSEVTFKGFGKHTDEEYWCKLSWTEIEKWAVENAVVEPLK